MWSKHPTTDPVRRRLVAAAGLVLAVAGVTTACGGDPRPPGANPGAHGVSHQTPTRPESSRPTPPRSTPAVAEPAPGERFPASRAKPQPDERSLQVADPEHVSIPALGISAGLKRLHLDAKGRLAAPPYGIAGWYAAGPEPGEQGPAVIAGHVDTEVGPDVFYGLGQARPGQRIRVRLTDGTTLNFHVTEVEQFSRGDFPTKRVYGDTEAPELRLITCGGDFDSAAGHYQDNLVVFADLAT